MFLAAVAVVVSIPTLTLLASTVLPLVVAVVTKQVSSAKLKSCLLAILSAVTALVTAGIQNQGLLTQEVLVTAVISFVTAAATYYGALKPMGIAPTVQEKTADFGVG